MQRVRIVTSRFSIIMAMAFAVFFGACRTSSAPSDDGIVSLDKSAISVALDEAAALTANRAVNWASTDEAIATVAEGAITPVAVGTATVTATSKADPSKFAACAVTVLESGAVILSMSASILPLDESLTLTSNRAVIWSSSDSAVATVADGVIAPVSKGTATIKATSAANGAKSAVCAITVIDIVPVSLSQATLTMTLHEVVTLTANKTATWTSSDPSIAAVSPAGTITPLAEGTVKIVAASVTTAANTASCAVTVTAVSSGSTGGPTITPNAVWFVKQANADSYDTTTATLTGGTIGLHNNYPSGGNAYKWVSSGNNYGANPYVSFLTFPVKMSGDFSIAATVKVSAQALANNACGLGVGAVSGFAADGNYFYMLMRNKDNQAVAYYTKGLATDPLATSVGTTGTKISYTAATQMTVTVRRVGSALYWNATPTGGTANAEQTNAIGNFYGMSGSVYPSIAFANVDAEISSLVVKDALGAEVFNSSTGSIEAYVPASLSLSSSAVDMVIGAAGSVTAKALAIGGALSPVTVAVDDASILSVTTIQATASGTVIGFKGAKAGTVTVTVSNDSDTIASTKTKSFTVTVNSFSATDAYGTIPPALLYPVPGSSSAYTDGELAITFDAEPTLVTGGTFRIMKKTDGSLVDSIGFAGERQSAWGSEVAVGDQLVRKAGNTLYITPHFGKLAVGTEYYVAAPTNAINATFNGVAFAGFSDSKSAATWAFVTKAAPAIAGSAVTVDGSQASAADFRTIQGALDYLDTGLAAVTDVVINVAAGTYRELIYYKGTKNLTIAGPAGNAKGDSCLIVYKNSSQMNGSTHTRASTYFSGCNVVLKNLTIKNAWVRAGGDNQAESIYFANAAATATSAAKTLAAYNCSFVSNQDTIQTSGLNWFYDCYIEGNTDYIWGTADAALFENCSLRCVEDGNSSHTAYLLVARTGTANAPTIGKGYVILNSTVTIDAGLTAYYGRNAGSGTYYDQAALVNVAFSGAGTLAASRWLGSTAPTKLGDSSYVGWKDYNVTGSNLAAEARYASSSAVIADMSAEYDSRGHILNRVITASGTAYGYADAANAWDTSALAAAFRAP